mmetsp:Transcript_25695/g.63552  ORF Transcript_25695/g.63552 Transcript_25695/m.63552 type:complete len:248 (+) Transcript_25695:293-1036(+)
MSAVLLLARVFARVPERASILEMTSGKCDIRPAACSAHARKYGSPSVSDVATAVKSTVEVMADIPGNLGEVGDFGKAGVEVPPHVPEICTRLGDSLAGAWAPLAAAVTAGIATFENARIANPNWVCCRPSVCAHPASSRSEFGSNSSCAWSSNSPAKNAHAASRTDTNLCIPGRAYEASELKSSSSVSGAICTCHSRANRRPERSNATYTLGSDEEADVSVTTNPSLSPGLNCLIRTDCTRSPDAIS